MGMVDILVPEEQEGTKAVVRSWLAKIGQMLDENDPLVELETDKVTQEVPAPARGVLKEILLESDAEAVPGAVLGRMELGEAEVAASDVVAEAERPNTAEAPRHDGNAACRGDDLPAVREYRLSPAVRRAIRQHDLDPAKIAGTGKGGRITRADVDRAIAARAEAPAPAAKQPQPASLAPVTSIPHDRMRLTIAQNMLNSVTTAPHVTSVFECDMSAIMAHRSKHEADFERDGTRLTYTAYFLMAAAKAMAAVPAINSRWFDDRLEIYRDVNIGVGTALGDKGLVVPVVKSCQDQSLHGIARNLTDLVARARDNKLTPADMRGGTFTISNHGVSGSLMASPIIINQPQSAILGIGKTEKRVVVREIDGVDTIQIRPMAYVSLTIDHRVVDGHQTNGWLARFVEVIEGWPLD